MIKTLLQKLKIENFYWNIGFYALILLGIGHIMFIFLFLYLDIFDLVILNIFSVIAYLYCIFGLGIKTLDTKDDSLIGWIVYFELIIHAVVVTRYIGVESGFQYYIYTLGMLPFFTSSYAKPVKILRIYFSIFIAMFIEVSRNHFHPFVHVDHQIIHLLHDINLFIFLLSMSIITYIYAQNAQQYQETLVNQNTLDPLTSLYNRRYLIQSVEKNILNSNIDGRKFALLLIDIDYFKKINDTYGHICGDGILVNLSTLLKKNLHPSSIISRWGGEEFLILLLNTDAIHLKQSAEKLRILIENNSIICNDKTIHITITLGGSVYQNNESFNTLLNRADVALYKGKEKGRNQVCIK